MAKFLVYVFSSYVIIHSSYATLCNLLCCVLFVRGVGSYSKCLYTFIWSQCYVQLKLFAVNTSCTFLLSSALNRANLTIHHVTADKNLYCGASVSSTASTIAYQCQCVPLKLMSYAIVDRTLFVI